MSYKPEDKLKFAQIDVLNMAELLKEVLTQKKVLVEREKTLKEELRGIMEEFDIRKLTNDQVTITMDIPILVDPAALGFESKEAYDKYTYLKPGKVAVSKKQLLAENPELYKKCIVEDTPRIKVK